MHIDYLIELFNKFLKIWTGLVFFALSSMKATLKLIYFIEESKKLRHMIYKIRYNTASRDLIEV